MNWGWLPWLVGSAGLWLVVIAILRRAALSDYELGRQAKRDGLPLNVRWSSKMRAGWADQWGDDARAKARADVLRQYNSEKN
jgi:hypothetical protein